MRRCRECGCGDLDACVYTAPGVRFPCYRVEEDLCSFCANGYTEPPDLRERVHAPGTRDVIIAGGIL